MVLGTGTQSFKSAEFLILEENLSVNFSLGLLLDLKFVYIGVYCTFILICYLEHVLFQPLLSFNIYKIKHTPVLYVTIVTKRCVLWQ